MNQKVESFFQKKRNVVQGVVFYFITLVAGIVLLIPIVSAVIIIFNSLQVHLELNAPSIFASFYCVTICLLVLKTKNKKNILTLAVSGFSFFFAAEFGIVFALLIPAALTMLPIQEGHKNAK